MYLHDKTYPLVSVIVPTYNNEARIARTLECLVSQDHPNTEIIVVNDVSTDATADIARQFPAGGRQIRIIERSVNGGQSAARNTGLDAAQGKYVIFFDHDDLAEKNYVSSLCGKAEHTDSDIVFCGYKEYYEDEGRAVLHQNVFSSASLSAGDCISAWIKGNFWCGIWCCIFKKEFLDSAKLRFPEGCQLGEDTEFLFKALVSTSHISFIKDILYSWVRHAKQQTSGCVPLRHDNNLFEQDMRSRWRFARYVARRGGKRERGYMLNLIIPEIILKRLNRAAKSKDRAAYDRLLRALCHRKVRELLLSTVKTILIEPELFFKSIVLLYFPNLYYWMRA